MEAKVVNNTRKLIDVV